MLILLAIPTVGILVTFVIDQIYDLDKMQFACTLPEIKLKPELAGACSDFENIAFLRNGSWLAFIVSLAIPLFYLIVATLVGQSRQLMALTFYALVKLSIFFTIGLVLVDAAIVVISLYYTFAFAVSRIPVGLLGMVGIGAIIAAVGLVASIFNLGGRLELKVLGKRLSQTDSTKLFEIVGSIAKKIGARPPDQIIVEWTAPLQ
jgi:hypothetical protein